MAKNKQPVAIILPIYNSGIHLKPAIDNILNNTRYPFKLIIIESSSTDGSDKICDDYAKKHDKIEVYHTKREGITKAINMGIKKAGELDVYLTQDDMVVHSLYKDDWLEMLVKGSLEKENCGVVTTIRGGGISGPTYFNKLPWAGTWSLFIPRSTIKMVGLFDENFSPGPGDDIDYSYRVLKVGLNIYMAQFWFEHHRLTENFNEKVPGLSDKNATYFRKKHRIGAGVTWESFKGKSEIVEKEVKNYGNKSMDK